MEISMTDFKRKKLLAFFYIYNTMFSNYNLYKETTFKCDEGNSRNY